MPDKPQTPDEKLQEEFNRWAAAGEGEKMRNHHLDITEKTIRLMNLRPGERVLDLGCGSGWATRLLARLVGDGPEGFGQVVGLDVSDEMIRRAREESKDFENTLYVWGSAQQIPWEENFFDKVLSVESFYYYPDQDRALMELFRVMAPRGSPPVSASREAIPVGTLSKTRRSRSVKGDEIRSPSADSNRARTERKRDSAQPSLRITDCIEVPETISLIPNICTVCQWSKKWQSVHSKPLLHLFRQTQRSQNSARPPPIARPVIFGSGELKLCLETAARNHG